jgi:histidine phosphotransferase ChpT
MTITAFLGAESMTDPRIAELLAARLCHELVGPVGAIGNGVELLTEDGADFAADAVALIGDSARQAASRLQFYRFAYGFDRTHGAAGPVPCELAAAFFQGTRVACDYHDGVRALPLDQQKLACNMLLCAAEALPRGGTLLISAGAAGPQIEAAGDGAALSPEMRAGLALATPLGELGSRIVQAYFTGLLAQALGRRIAVEVQTGRLRLALSP